MTTQYSLHRLRNIIRELSALAGDVSEIGRGRIAMHHLTRAMTEIESAVRHIEAQGDTDAITIRLGVKDE